MNVLIVNPTSNENLNNIIYKIADCAAKFSARNSEDYTHISVISLDKAPKRIVSSLDIGRVSALLLEKIEGLKNIYDGFIIAHHADVGISALRELTGKPVILSGAASVYPAPIYGRKIAILGRTIRDIEIYKDTLRYYGIFNENMTFFPIFSNNNEASYEKILECVLRIIRQAQRELGIEVIVLSDVEIGFLTDKIKQQITLPVMEGLSSAMIRIEYMVYQ